MFISKAFIFLYSWRSSLSSKDRLVLPKTHFLQKGVDKHWTKLIHFAFQLPPQLPSPSPDTSLKLFFQSHSILSPGKYHDWPNYRYFTWKKMIWVSGSCFCLPSKSCFLHTNPIIIGGPNWANGTATKLAK